MLPAAAGASPAPASAHAHKGGGVEEEEEVVGAAVAQKDGPTVELLTVCVRPEWRKQGLGLCLLAQMLQQAQTRHHATRVAVDVSASNLPALSFFKRAGFRPVPDPGAGTSGKSVRLVHELVQDLGLHEGASPAAAISSASSSSSATTAAFSSSSAAFLVHPGSQGSAGVAGVGGGGGYRTGGPGGAGRYSGRASGGGTPAIHAHAATLPRPSSRPCMQAKGSWGPGPLACLPRYRPSWRVSLLTWPLR